MVMLLHIGAVAGGGAVEIHVTDEVALHEGIEAIINRGHGDIGHGFLGADKNVFDRGMIALLEQDIIDVLALRRETEAAGREPLIKPTVRDGIIIRSHDGNNLTSGRNMSIFGIILNHHFLGIIELSY